MMGRAYTTFEPRTPRLSVQRQPRHRFLSLIPSLNQVAALVTAGVTAHWTHDESLAREIGPPAGQEDDMDVHALSDSLLSEEENAKTAIVPAKRQFRMTIGTKYVASLNAALQAPPLGNFYNGASNSQFQVYLAGTNKKFKKDGSIGFAGLDKPSAQAPTDASWSKIQYYVGPALSYADAVIKAPQLHPGMIPLITETIAPKNCYGLDQTTGLLRNCGADGYLADVHMIRCEPGTKMCATMLQERNGQANGVGNVGYTPFKPRGTEAVSFGLIQRGQVWGLDVGEINMVTIREEADVGVGANACLAKGKAAWECSNAWFPAFAKINTNDPKTGIGNGVYYIAPAFPGDQFVGSFKDSSGEIHTGVLVAKPGPVDADATVDSPHNAKLTKCAAQVCEEEMDQMYGTAMLETAEFLG